MWSNHFLGLTLNISWPSIAGDIISPADAHGESWGFEHVWKRDDASAYSASDGSSQCLQVIRLKTRKVWACSLGQLNVAMEMLTCNRNIPNRFFFLSHLEQGGGFKVPLHSALLDSFRYHIWVRLGKWWSTTVFSPNQFSGRQIWVVRGVNMHA